MWIGADDVRFEGWERKSPEERVDLCTLKIWEARFDRKPERSSLYFRLVQSLGQEAIKANPLPTTDEAERVFEPIESFVLELYSMVTNYNDEERPNFWRHDSSLLQNARAGSAPPIRREDAESIAAGYLSLPYRSPVADRMFVDMLIAGELFAFAQEVFSQRKAQRFIGGGPLAFLTGRGCTLALALLLGACAFVVKWLGLISDNTFLIVLLVLAGLFLLETAWALFRFPFAWRAQATHNARTAKLVTDMNGVYCELNSIGPISARHIRERAQAASATGAVWPGPLFVILEEAIERGGRL